MPSRSARLVDRRLARTAVGFRLAAACRCNTHSRRSRCRRSPSESSSRSRRSSMTRQEPGAIAVAGPSTVSCEARGDSMGGHSGAGSQGRLVQRVFDQMPLILAKITLDEAALDQLACLRGPSAADLVIHLRPRLKPVGVECRHETDTPHPCRAGAGHADALPAARSPLRPARPILRGPAGRHARSGPRRSRRCRAAATNPRSRTPRSAAGVFATARPAGRGRSGEGARLGGPPAAAGVAGDRPASSARTSGPARP